MENKPGKTEQGSERLHPNRVKLLKHATWLRAKAVEHPRARRMLETLADGMEMMSKESTYSLENQHGEVVLQKGITDIAVMLKELGDPPDMTLIAQMAEDVMLPLPSSLPLQ